MADPTPTAPEDGSVDVVNEFGTVGAIPASQLQAAVSQGYTLATPEQVQYAKDETAYGGLAGTVAAPIARFAGTATLGATDKLGQALGFSDDLRKLREHNEVGSGVGDVAGALAPLFMSGGASGVGLLARAARFGSAPVRSVARLGAEIAGGGGSLLRIGAGAAAEGAFYGAGSAVTESALQNKDLTAEAVMHAMGTGAMYGGAMGIGFAGAGRVLAKGVRQGSNLLTRAIDHVGDSVGKQSGKARETLIASLHLNSGGAAGTLDDVARRVDDALGDGAGGLRDAKAAYDDAFNVAKADTEALYNAKQTFHKANSGAAKAEQIAQHVKRGNEDMIATAAMARADEMVGALDAIKANPDAFAVNGINKLAKSMKKLRADLGKAAKEGGELANARVNVIADQMKREWGNLAYSGKYSGKGRAGGGMSSLERATYDVLDQQYQGVRKFLEVDDLWGAAAGYQRDLNAAWAKMIGSGDVVGFDHSFGRTVKGDKGFKRAIWDEKSTAKTITGLYGEHSGQARQQMLTHLKDVAQAGEVMRLSPYASAESKAAGKVMSEAGGKLNSNLDRMLTQTEALGIKQTVAEQTSAAALLAKGVAYGLGGGLLGKAASATATFVSNPTGALQRIVALDRVAGGVTKRLTQGSKALTRASKSGALGLRAAHVGRLAATGIARRTREPENNQERYERAATSIRTMAADRAGTEDAMRRMLGSVQTAAPELVDIAIGKQLAAADYLQQHLPTSEMPRTPWELPPVPSKVEQAEFLRRLEVVQDPLVVIQRLEEGRLTAEHVDALKNTAPAMYEELRANVFDGLTDAASKGEAPPFARRLQLGVLLDMPTDPMLDPAIMADLQAMYVNEQTPEAAQQEGPPGTAPNIAGAYIRSSNRLAREDQ